MRATHQVIDGREWLTFHGNDTHRLTRHPRVIEAIQSCLRTHGWSVSASRKTTGDHPLYRELEERLAAYLGFPSCVLLPSGYLANQAAMTLVGPDDEVAAPMRLHPAWRDALRGRSTALYGPTSGWIVGDPIDANTGRVSMADVGKLARQATLDDCHGVGVVAGGRGIAAWLDPRPQHLVVTGTLSKALGAFGGFVAATRAETEQIRSESGAYVGSTPVPLPVAAAALAAFQVLVDEPWRPARAVDLAARIGGDDPARIGAIVSVARPREPLATRLAHAGIFPPFVQYPGAPEGGHFRFSVGSEHTDAEVDRLLDVLSS